MVVSNLYSKRQKQLRGENPDVYKYDEVPNQLRVQIVHIWQDALGNNDQYLNQYPEGPLIAYKYIVETLRREYGVFHLTGTDPYRENHFKELVDFFLREQDTERVIDVIEASFKVIDRLVRRWDYLQRQDCDTVANAAIKELNERFQEHAIGFRFEGGEIVRVDSELLHAEVVQRTLSLLQGKPYKGAEAEFLSAHEHYRHGRNKEALTDCLKSFESVMKAICDKRKWTYDKAKDTSSTLISICLKHELIPPFWTTHFSSLRSMLESSIPTVRNKLSGHGQGVDIVEVPPFLAAYVLHMTAATILFLVEAEKALK
jgi:hypothetical protein